MITKDLGYCCAELFFMVHQDKNKVADRLGVTPDTIKKWKSRVEKGEACCREHSDCIKRRLGKDTVRLAAKALKRST